MITVLFALGAALAYGLSDFLGGVSRSEEGDSPGRD